MGAKRLAALSVHESKATRAIGANTSQKGNGSNFRNEMVGAVNKQSPLAVDGQVRILGPIYTYHLSTS